MNIPGIGAINDFTEAVVDTAVKAKGRAETLLGEAVDASRSAGSRARQDVVAFGEDVNEAGQNVRHVVTETADNVIGWVGDKAEVIRNDLEAKVERISNWPEASELWFGGPGSAIGQSSAEIDKLNSDGDKVIIDALAGGELQLPIPIPGLGQIPILGPTLFSVGVGANPDYGYGIVVEQVGNEPPPGSGGAPPKYTVTFNKNLWLGMTLEPSIPVIDPVLEAYGVSHDTVTMTFDSKEEAARAVRALSQTALAETVHDLGIVPNFPGSNPVADNGNDSISSRTLTDPLADRLQPSDADWAFLQDHITSYSTTGRTKNRARNSFAGINMGLDPRFDGDSRVTRTVTLPQDGKPGSVTYSYSGTLSNSTRQQLVLGLGASDQATIGYKPMVIAEHGSATAEISMTWDLPDSAFQHRVSGRPVPEAALLDGLDFSAPDHVSVKMDAYYQKPDLEASRTNLGHFQFKAVSDHPGPAAMEAFQALLDGDIPAAARAAGDDVTLTAAHEDLERHGIYQQHWLGFNAPDTFTASLELFLTIGRDDVMNRHDLELGS